MSVSYATNPAEMDQRLAAYPPPAYPILLQQRVVGPGMGVFLLLWDGVIYASFCHRRSRKASFRWGQRVSREHRAADVPGREVRPPAGPVRLAGRRNGGVQSRPVDRHPLFDGDQRALLGIPAAGGGRGRRFSQPAGRSRAWRTSGPGDALPPRRAKQMVVGRCGPAHGPPHQVEFGARAAAGLSRPDPGPARFPPALAPGGSQRDSALGRPGAMVRETLDWLRRR